MRQGWRWRSWTSNSLFLTYSYKIWAPLKTTFPEQIFSLIQKTGFGVPGDDTLALFSGSSSGIIFSGPTITLIEAPTSGERFGRTCAFGDLNGDGIDDLIVGAPMNEDGVPGKTYIYFGGSTFDTTVDLTLTGGAADDEFGTAIAGSSR